MASAINDTAVWTSIVEPVPTLGFLERYGRIWLGRDTQRRVTHVEAIRFRGV